MMKLNQLLMSFLLVLGLTNITLQAGQAARAIKGAGKGFATAARIATNRASKQEEQIFMAVNAGVGFLQFLHGLLKETPTTTIEPGQSPTFIQTLCLTITGHNSIGDALRRMGQENLDQLVQWFKEQKRREMIANDYTPDQIRNNMEKIDKATAPVVRLLKGQSKVYERVAIWISLKFVSLINGIRNKFTSGRKLDDTSTMIGEATAFIASLGVNRALVIGQQGLEYVTQVASNTIQATTEAVNSAHNIMLSALDNIMNSCERALNILMSPTFQGASDSIIERASNFVLRGLSGLGKVTFETIEPFINRFRTQEENFYDAPEISDLILGLFTDKEELTNLLSTVSSDEYAQKLSDIILDFQAEFKAKNISSTTIDLLFNNLDKKIMEETLRSIDLTDFSKLPNDQLKIEITKAWKNAKSTTLVEALVDLQQTNIDRILLKTIGENREWEKITPEKFIQIPETLYDFLSITTLAQIEKVLRATPKDFDIINKLTSLSLVTENAWKKATVEDLINFPTELYSKISEAHLQQIETQIRLADEQLPLEDQMDNPYEQKITLIQTEQIRRKTATGDSQAIAQQAADGKKQQADQVAQHTTTTTTQPEKPTPSTTTQPDLPDFDGSSSRPRSDSTSSTTSNYYDAQETAEEIAAQEAADKAHQEALEEQKTQEETAKKEAQEKSIENQKPELNRPEVGK